jgi:hypothetical protein
MSIYLEVKLVTFQEIIFKSRGLLLLPGAILMLRTFLSMELKLECSLRFLLNFIVTVPCLPMFYIIALISVTFLLNVIFIPLSADLF